MDAVPENPNSGNADSSSKRTNRSVAPHVRRQLSMADLDEPRGPSALTSSANSTFVSTTGMPCPDTCHHVACCRQRNQRGMGHQRPLCRCTNDNSTSMTSDKL
ncbi:unnamed protein product [Schistocephalus solidus]|uniref:Uncharacterized protein n=1 Tax=Schistocephalus solidus TaxID=70667 RepID=A0A183SJ83_SCHSO|nr:unnamed protein product [Schistocephalus solidus]